MYSVLSLGYSGRWRSTGTVFTRRYVILISHKPDFLICADEVRRQAKPSIASNQKQANDLGRFNHITIMKVGTLSGVTWLIQPRRLNGKSLFSSGELISFI